MTEFTNQTTTSFEIDMTPGDAFVVDSGRMNFTKTWNGAMFGHGEGVMLSAGNPTTGTAGYVALEKFTGTIDGRNGTCFLQQLGAMTGGHQDLRYQVVPGSGTGDLEGITGVLDLTSTTARTAECCTTRSSP